MESSRDAPNPLRPYYIPPSIGIPHDTTAQNVSAAPNRYTVRATSPPRPKTSNLRSSARDYFDGLDYADYLPDRSPSIGEMVKRIMDQAIWNYTSVLLAQPFEVAKTVLQVHLASGGPGIVQPKPSRASSGYGHNSDSLRRGGYGQDGGGYQDVGRISTSGPSSPMLLRMNTNSGLTPGAGQSSYFEVEEEQPDDDDDSDSDSPSYFTSSAPRINSPAYPASPAHSFPSHPSRQSSYQRQQKPPSRSHSTTPTPGSMPHLQAKDNKLELRRPDAVLEVIAQLWQKEAAWGVWKGTNMTFVYNILLRTIEAWIRNVLAALMNLPEAGAISMGVGGASLAASAGGGIGNASGLDILESSSPLASLGVAVAAAGITGLMLSPLDVLRTRLIVTTTTTVPRAILPSLRLLPSLSQIYHSIGTATLLHSTIPSFISNSAPLFLRTFLRIDPILTPTLYSVSSFGAAIGELFVRLPLETVLRRGQVAVLKDESRRRQLTVLKERGRGRSESREPAGADLKTVIEAGPYKGVFGTMWFIACEEGYSTPSAASKLASSAPNSSVRTTSQPKQRKGQGVKSLWRGWRVGFWGLVGVWGAAALNSGNPGGEF